MKEKTFTFLSDLRIRQIIENAEDHLIYAAPSLSSEIAEGILNFLSRNPSSKYKVFVDAEPESLRLGFGQFAGLQILIRNDITISKANGLRLGVLVADDSAWVFSPTAEFIFEQPDERFLNAAFVSKDFVDQIIASIAPSTIIRDDVLDIKVIADKDEPEFGEEKLGNDEMEAIEEDLKRNPPQQFSAARKVRVYSGHFQFVEIKLNQCQIRSHKITLPNSLINFATSPNVKEKLHANYQLIDETSEIISGFDLLTKSVAEVRENFTSKIGRYGRIIPSPAKPDFDKEVQSIREQIGKLKKVVETELDGDIEANHLELTDALFPSVKADPPPKLKKQAYFNQLDDKTIRDFVYEELERSIPDASKFVDGMSLEVDYKDITYEMLKDENFVEMVKSRYPGLEDILSEADALKEKPA